MRVIDITHKLDENVAIYEGDPRFSMETWSTVQDNGYMLSKLRMGTHPGTHMDAPCHFIEGGKTAAELPIKQFVGKCLVTDNIKMVEPGCHRVILKGKGRLNLDEAQWLIDHRVHLVGTAALSIGNDQVHKLLLGNECAVLELLDLKDVEKGRYILCAAPLKIEADGSPVRACLIEPD